MGFQIVISPAKSIDCSRWPKSGVYTEPRFKEEANYLAKKLGQLSPAKLKEIYKASDAIADLNHQRFADWDAQFEEGEVGIAGTMFTGEVYRGLDLMSWSEEDLKYGQNHLNILSGLYGILRPLDKVPAYRLEMGSAWGPTPKQNNLYKFWGSSLADTINEKEGEYLINLASNEYFKGVDKKALKKNLLTVNFKENKDGKFKTIMMYAKNARGLFAKYIIQNKIDNLASLKEFNLDGYSFNAELSSEKEYIFTR